jgi:hypothetical protein
VELLLALSAILHFSNEGCDAQSMREERNAYRRLVGKPEEKRPSGKPRRRWKDNIKVDLTEIRCSGMDWIDLAQGRDQLRALVNMVMNLWAL